MSDAMTDRRGQAKQVLTTEELDEFTRQCKQEFRRTLIKKDVMKDAIVAQARGLADDLASLAWMIARDIER